jgi:steroid 5-alpha reductase family enzyme
MPWDYLQLTAVLLFVYMCVAFLFAKKRNQLNVVDVAWCGGFVLVAWSTYAQMQAPRTLLVAVLVTLWGLRLMSHLLKRVRSGQDDPRYLDLKKKWKGNVWRRAFFMIFMLQALLVLIVSLPVTMTANPLLGHTSWAVYTGAVIWFIGFTIERLADAELAEFIKNRKDKNAVLDTGSWKFSRHPNYFGELTQWWGIGIIALQAERGWIGFIGPLTLTLLIVFVSGIPPIENKKKSNPAYAAYMKRTSMLIPLPPKQ